MLVRGGRIEALLAPEAVPAGTPRARLRELRVVMPGLVDSHVHVNEPGRTEWEGFATRDARRRRRAGSRRSSTCRSTASRSRPALARARSQARGGARPVPRRRRVLGRRRPGQRRRARADARGRRARGQVLPDRLGRRRVSGRDRGRPARGHARSWPRTARAPGARRAAAASSRPPRSGPPERHATWLASRPRAWENEAIALLIRAVARVPAAGSTSSTSRRPTRSTPLAAARAAGRPDHRRDLSALSGLRRRGDPRRPHRVQVRAADPRAREPRAALARPARRHDRHGGLRPLALRPGAEGGRRLHGRVGRHRVAAAVAAGGLDARRASGACRSSSVLRWMCERPGAARRPRRTARAASRRATTPTSWSSIPTRPSRSSRSRSSTATRSRRTSAGRSWARCTRPSSAAGRCTAAAPSAAPQGELLEATLLMEFTDLPDLAAERLGGRALARERRVLRAARRTC